MWNRQFALVAEDEHLIAGAIQDVLEEGGYAVNLAANGRDALAALEDPTSQA